MTGAGTETKVFLSVKRVKEYLKGLPAKMADSLVAKIVGLVVASVLAGSFWKWLTTEHSLRMYGVLWVTAVLALGGLPVGTLWIIGRKQQKILHHKDEDILVVMEHRLREYDGKRRNEILMDFRVCDRKWHLKRGSAKRLLPILIENDATWHIKNHGDETMIISRGDRRVAIAKHLNRA